ncbi:MAG: hypothetical protein ACPGVU_04085 [Limisphaerales bacterium]
MRIDPKIIDRRREIPEERVRSIDDQVGRCYHAFKRRLRETALKDYRRRQDKFFAPISDALGPCVENPSRTEQETRAAILGIAKHSFLYFSHGIEGDFITELALEACRTALLNGDRDFFRKMGQGRLIDTAGVKVHPNWWMPGWEIFTLAHWIRPDSPEDMSLSMFRDEDIAKILIGLGFPEYLTAKHILESRRPTRNFAGLKKMASLRVRVGVFKGGLTLTL